MGNEISKKSSIFEDDGFKKTVARHLDEVAALYLSDQIPWVIGYSGGKDSTAVLQLIWLALERLPPSKRHKPVHVINTDTLVENPVVVAWVTHSLRAMSESAAAKSLPIQPHQLTPALKDTFWVNLIGRGYPAPRHKFRWCTERLKIKPSNKFIRDVVAASGEAIVVLGTRKAESAARGKRMEALEKTRVRHRLSPNTTLPNCLVFSPIEEWTDDDVWLFLMQIKNPWGYRNKDLLTMYQGASRDGECPLVVDTSTPSCGNSRFGCWVCTLVSQDRSMTAMIQNDAEKEWMLPLLELRNALDVPDDRHLRDFRRTSGAVQLYQDRPIPGPYTQDARAQWLRQLLEAQQWVRENGPPEVRAIDLITHDELNEIRRIWVLDKHELEDLLPALYEDVTGAPFAAPDLNSSQAFGAKEMATLRALCGDDRLHFELIRELLDVQQRMRTMTRRAGLFEAIDAAFKKHSYQSEEDAVALARSRAQRLDAIRRVGAAPDEEGSPDDF